MGRLIAVLALAGAAALASHPRSNERAPETARAAAAHVSTNASDVTLTAVERDFAGREAEVGLVGSAPLFGAEGLPKPTK